MARNEEKQLARLNRVYLQKQREEELKKRPPRPKLETLSTPADLRKWLPTITRDIEFYVKQMEVPCYRDQQIEEFNRRISHLKGEYKAFLRKLRELDPDNRLTHWTDRPYTVKKCKVSSDNTIESSSKDCDLNNSDEIPNDHESTKLPTEFVPLQTPVLDNDEQAVLNFGYERPVVADCPSLSDEGMNEPLQFAPLSSFSASQKNSYYNNRRSRTDIITKYKTQSELNKRMTEETRSVNKPSYPPSPKDGSDGDNDGIVSRVPIKKSLNLPYSDSSSSSSGDET